MANEALRPSLTSDVSRLCEVIGDVSVRLDAVRFALFGQTSQVPASDQPPAPVLRRDLDRAFVALAKIVAALEKIESQI